MTMLTMLLVGCADPPPPPAPAPAPAPVMPRLVNADNAWTVPRARFAAYEGATADCTEPPTKKAIFEISASSVLIDGEPAPVGTMLQTLTAGQKQCQRALDALLVAGPDVPRKAVIAVWSQLEQAGWTVFLQVSDASPSAPTALAAARPTSVRGTLKDDGFVLEAAAMTGADPEAAAVSQVVAEIVSRRPTIAEVAFEGEGTWGSAIALFDALAGSGVPCIDVIPSADQPALDDLGRMTALDEQENPEPFDVKALDEQEYPDPYTVIEARLWTESPGVSKRLPRELATGHRCSWGPTSRDRQRMVDAGMLTAAAADPAPSGAAAPSGVAGDASASAPAAAPAPTTPAGDAGMNSGGGFGVASQMGGGFGLGGGESWVTGKCASPCSLDPAAKKAAGKTVRRTYSKLEGCHSKRLSSHGRMVIELSVSGGKIASAKAISDRTGDSGLKSCALQALKGSSVDAPDGALKWQFDFETK